MTMDLNRRKFLLGAALSAVMAVKSRSAIASAVYVEHGAGIDSLKGAKLLERALESAIQRVLNPPWLVHEDGRLELLDNDQDYQTLVSLLDRYREMAEREGWK